MTGRQLGPYPCAICQTIIEAGHQSRPLARSQASQYGLREDQVQPGARVCNTCRCKSVRGRCTTCPLPTCPNASGNGASGSSGSAMGPKQRIKRLRALPPKWMDLPPEIRDSIVQEFQIPSNATKCCSTCFSRISRRLAPHFANLGESQISGTSSSTIVEESPQWSEEEIDRLKKGLHEHGPNWQRMHEVVRTKSDLECKQYYMTFRKRLSLDQLVAEYYQAKGEDRRPCLTDEEESNSSTSSCDEMPVHDSSDTRSADSPTHNHITSSAQQAGLNSSSMLGVLQHHQSHLPPVRKVILLDGGSGSVPHSGLLVSPLCPSISSATVSATTLSTSTTMSAKEDYDSSATETADEVCSVDLENSGNNPSNATANPINQQQASQQMTILSIPPPQQSASSPPSSAGNNPLTVKDLMLGVIEMQLKRNPNTPNDPVSSVPVSSGTPTISSILTEHRFPYKAGSSSSGSALQQHSRPSEREQNRATLSVVSNPHHGHRAASSPQQLGQIQTSLTASQVAASSQQQQTQAQQSQSQQGQPNQDMLPKEGLVVMQVQQTAAMRDTEGTLDLSIKKPRQQEQNHMLQPPQQVHKPTVVSHYRPEPPQPTTYYHPHPGHPGHPEPPRGATKSPHIYVSSPRPQAPITTKIGKVQGPQVGSHQKQTQKMSGMPGNVHKPGGSITHGTPVTSTRFEVLRQMTPPGNINQSNPSPNPASGKEGGSITQGTPVHQYAVDKRSGALYDYHRSIRHSPVSTANVPQQSPSSGVVVSHGQSSSSGSQYNSYTPRQPSNYAMEPMSSRQIIMNDYITSQQMLPRNRGGNPAEANKSETQAPGSMYCANTPPPQSHQQPRQGVIQRHNTPKLFTAPPPGLEAFSSLVDVAVQQPSLPVPHAPPSAPSSSGTHEGLVMSIERMYGDRYGGIDSRGLPRMPRGQVTQYQMAVAMEHQQREREIMREKEEQEQQQQQRIQREKEHQQQMDRIHQREKEIQQQQQEHRLVQQQQEMAAAHAQAAADHRAAVQREKEIHHQDQHRLSIQREMDKQHYRLVQQQQHIEKEMQHMAAAQREKEHQEHKMAVAQREREIQQQQQQEMRIAHQKREKEMAQQQAYLQQRYQKQQSQHMQHRMESERQRNIVSHISYKDIESQNLYRDMTERQCDSPANVKTGAYYQPSRIQQQSHPPAPSSSRQQHNQTSSSSSSSSSQQGKNNTLTAASLIDAIITHQINQGSGSDGSGQSNSNQPTRPGDRLFQGFHRDSPAEPNGMVHSPANDDNSNRDNSSSSGIKGLTIAEHVEHVVNKDYTPSMSSYRPYSGYQIADDQWKRRKGATEPEPGKSGDERQIIRVAQQQKPSSSSQSQQSQQQSSKTSQQQQSSQPTYHTEPVSPPEPTSNHFSRRFYEASTATTTTSSSSTQSNKSHLSPLDYVKNKIVEVMRTEDDKTSSGERNGSSSIDKDDKADNSPRGDMVIDESPNIQSTSHSQQAPPQNTPANFYPYNALGVHTGPPPPPPQANAVQQTVVSKSEEPAPLLSAQYEPLSDED
ncbi:hypothetical protein TKK_0000973 [Trichogramma kaykai]